MNLNAGVVHPPQTIINHDGQGYKGVGQSLARGRRREKAALRTENGKLAALREPKETGVEDDNSISRII